MSEKDHIIENPTDVQAGGFGKRHPENYTSAYANSPIYSGDMTDSTVRKVFAEGVQTEDPTDAFDAYGRSVAGGVGNRMSSFNVDFVGDSENPVPDIAGNTQTSDGKAFGDGQGAPSSPYIPPLTSPGPGSVSATDQPAYTGNLPDPALNVEFGSGLGGLTSPHETSPEIATQDTVTAFISGRSYAGSAG
jgi:hypothetical protein